MKKLLFICLFVLIPLAAQAQKPAGGDFGFGIILGEPTGASINYFFSRQNSLDAYLGTSYFGGLALGADYLWHFNAFKSRIIFLYTGVGGALGFGTSRGVFYSHNKKYKIYDRDGIGVGIRGLLGLELIPSGSQFQIFFELGMLVQVVPHIATGLDVGLGFRFYP